MTTVQGWLDRVEYTAAQAAPGPWTASDLAYNSSASEPETIVVHTGAFDWTDLARGDAESFVADVGGWDYGTAQNAAFIAAARTDLPAAIAALRAVLAEAEVADSDATLGAGEPQIGYVPSNHLRRAIATALGATQ